jgi:hypothetical protein
MKRRTTRKKQQDLRKKKKAYFTDMICGIVLVIIFAILSFTSLYSYNQKPLTYTDVEYKEFTVEYFEERGGKKSSSRHFYVYVKEEKQPLIINSVTTSYYIKQKLYEVKEGDTISCYVKPNSGAYSYTIVELKYNEMIFSLDYYNEQNKSDNLIGLIVMPICAIVFTVFTLIFAKKYKKLKNANP